MRYKFVFSVIIVLLVILFLELISSIFYNNTEWFVPDYDLGWKQEYGV